MFLKKTRAGSADSRNQNAGKVSIEEFMRQLDEDMAPDTSLETSLSSAESVEIITDRVGRGRRQEDFHALAGTKEGEEGEVRKEGVEGEVREERVEGEEKEEKEGKEGKEGGRGSDRRMQCAYAHAALVLAPDEEARQQLIIHRDGQVVFRSATYGKGKGHYGVGRYETTAVSAMAIREIFQLLDTWLFVQGPQPWDPEDENGSWVIRARHEEGPVEMVRGRRSGAYVDGIDISGFIRQRIPIGGLFLFDK